MKFFSTVFDIRCSLARGPAAQEHDKCSTAQILTRLISRYPGIVGRDVKITLSNHRGNVMHTITNQFGEFRGEIENTGDLEFSFPGQGEKTIAISLRNALGDLPGSKS